MGRWAQIVSSILAVMGLSLGPDQPSNATEIAEAQAPLRIAMTQLPDSTFPPIHATSEARYLGGFIGRSLTIYDRSWAVACALCVELPTFANGGARTVTRADGRKGIDVTFDLDPALAWDDGAPVTAADVVFSVEVAHKFGSGTASLPNVIEAVPEGDHRVTLRISDVRFDYNRFEELFLLPAHLEKAIFDAAATPAEYRARSLYTVDPTASGLAYGPFKLGRKTSDEILLTRNPHWHGKPPHFDQILLRKITDSPALEADFQAGRIDIIAGEVGMDLAVIYRLEAEDKTASHNFIYKPTLQYEHIDFNLSNGLLQDRRIRRAMLLSLDRPIEISGRERQTMGAAPRSFLSPNSPNFDPTLPPAPYDPVQAASLFDEAGFRRGADGVRTDSAGRRLSFTLTAQLDFDLNRRLLGKIRDQWRDVGVEVTLQDGQVANILSKRRFDLAFYSWKNLPEFVLEPVYTKSGIPTAENGYRGQNYPGLDDDDMNRVAASLTTEMDPGKRLLLWRQAQQIYAETLPALPLAFVPNEYVIPATMTGFEPTGHLIPTSYWVEDWQLR